MGGVIGVSTRCFYLMHYITKSYEKYFILVALPAGFKVDSVI
jgi:hypothetical protein